MLIMSRINPISCIDTYFLKIDFKIILPCTMGLGLIPECPSECDIGPQIFISHRISVIRSQMLPKYYSVTWWTSLWFPIFIETLRALPAPPQMLRVQFISAPILCQLSADRSLPLRSTSTFHSAHPQRWHLLLMQRYM